MARSDCGQRAYDLLVVGRPSADVTFAGLSAWPALGMDMQAGALGVAAGTSFNTPAAANRLGMRVAYVSAVGNDVWGRLIADEFDREGLPKVFLKHLSQPHPFVSVALNMHGDRGFVTFDSQAGNSDTELHQQALEVLSAGAARHLHSYIYDGAVELARAARAGGATVSFDSSGGQGWESSLALEDALPLCDILFANEPEAIAMTAAHDVGGALQALADECAYVVVKRDTRGAMASVNGRIYEVGTETVPVADATGAGDCFNAGFLYGWLRGLPPDSCLGLGNLCGAAAVQALGGYGGCPTEEQLLVQASRLGIVLAKEIQAR